VYRGARGRYIGRRGGGLGMTEKGLVAYWKL